MTSFQDVWKHFASSIPWRLPSRRKPSHRSSVPALLKVRLNLDAFKLASKFFKCYSWKRLVSTVQKEMVSKHHSLPFLLWTEIDGEVFPNHILSTLLKCLGRNMHQFKAEYWINVVEEVCTKKTRVIEDRFDHMHWGFFGHTPFMHLIFLQWKSDKIGSISF